MRFFLFILFLFVPAFGHTNLVSSAGDCYFEIKIAVSPNKTVGCFSNMTKEHKCGIKKEEDFSINSNNTLFLATIKDTTNFVFRMNTWLNRRSVLRNDKIRQLLLCLYFDIKDSPNRVPRPPPKKTVAYASYVYPVAASVIFVICVVFSVLDVRDMRRDYLKDKEEEKILVKQLLKQKRLAEKSATALIAKGSKKDLFLKFHKIPSEADRDYIASHWNDLKEKREERKLGRKARLSKKSLRAVPGMTSVNSARK